MRCVIFAYDFPHWKSWLGIQEIALSRFSDLLVLAAPRISLASPPTSIVARARKVPSAHPSDVCRVLGVDYVAMPHAGTECEQLLSSYHADVGIILGARILPEPILRATGCPIVNIHPGILPENRGLDTVVWAVAKGWPQGVTAHIISIGRIDAGPLLGMYVLDQLSVGECLVEVSARLDSLQLALLFQVSHSMALEGHVPSGVASPSPGEYHSYFSGSETYLAARLQEYRHRYSEIVNGWAAGRTELLRDLGAGFGWAEALDMPIRFHNCRKWLRPSGPLH
jgi:folate-dependent phosphoribosylglycinamide formyltransferase PurN